MKACGNCGTGNLDDARFCDACGAPFEVWQRPPTINRRAPRAVLTAGATGSIFELFPDREMLIGRGDPDRGIAADIALVDETALAQGVSRLHAKVFCSDNTFYLSDLNSTNSTYQNGRRLEPQQPSVLSDGDEITLGRYSLKLKYL